MEVTDFTFSTAPGARTAPAAPPNVAYRPMTWRKATEYYIKDFDTELNDFRRNASTIGTFLRKFGTLKWPWFASALGFIDDLATFTPAAPVTITTTAIAIPTAIFMAYSAHRIRKIKRNADELGWEIPYIPKKSKRKQR